MGNTSRVLDDVAWAILELLQENARLSYTEIGRRVGLSDTGVADRIQRLEDAGIIRGYRVELDAAAVGLPILAFVRVNVYSSRLSGEQIESLIQAAPEVLEMHSMAGEECYLLKVAVSSIRHLDKFLLELWQANLVTATSIVLSSPVASRAINPAALARMTKPES
ncbi:MAG TPA: Lrp/AsnC family transcriptional regulator [Phototrophicaceae bacterium]|nr:Lrp/AsnC family transcriptional regulator [Phototrophicaceae bacterium]